ncbi:hypothetical protein [Roseovarius sp. EL26]|uniref:hypothetical protein n=1 Tax=Roseovarius sp. EL26 TaxID=2126672 RepID=UPI0013C42CD3|nr:hypothetical protein [Roseovarius sp. EL26]
MTSVPLSAQSQSQIRGSESFASENAILDTSVLFAIGAQEARQAIRGSFGWPTFQEGLVEGVYFRFDPDGYARFSPSPRLDSDVFEVVCRPRTYSCMGRKGGLSMMLTSRGQLQLKFEDVMPADRFFVASGVSEIQVPERILQPLDHQFEALLATGGELIVRRGEDELIKASLEGFHPVVTYLRWVMSRQDYTVLPRGWPVPNSLDDGSQPEVTNVASWQSPMPQPQVLAVDAFGSGSTNEIVEELKDASISDVREELKFLRELLLERSAQPANHMSMDTAHVPTEPVYPAVARLTDFDAMRPSELDSRLKELQDAANEIRTQIDRINGNVRPIESARHGAYPDPIVPAVNSGEINMGLTQGTQMAQIDQASSGEEVKGADLSHKLAYLIEEVGLDSKTAIAVLQTGISSGPPSVVIKQPHVTEGVTELYQSDVVSEILRELEGDLVNTTENTATAAVAGNVGAQPVSEGEYKLLSNYFKSVVFPELRHTP